MSDSLIKEHSDAYMQLATLQTKLDEDDHILSRLQQDSADHHAAIDLITERRKELDRELRKVKKRIREIEGMWRGSSAVYLRIE